MNIRLQTKPQVKTTIAKHPDFQTLPTGAKEMLLFSEAHFPDHPSHEREHIPGETIPLTFGDFVAGVYHTWGKRKAKGIVQLALKMNVVEFRGTERFVFS